MAGLRPLRREPSKDKATLELQNHAEAIDTCPILDGQEVTFTYPTGTNDYQIRHSLGRAFRGGWITGISTTASPSSVFNFIEPTALSAAGVDIRSFFQLSTSTTTTATYTIKVWIY